jgi:hypothetical protein
MKGITITALPMPEKPVDAHWCVYAHSLDGNVFYIGCGKKERPFNSANRGRLWKVIVSVSRRYEVQILEWFSDETTAYERETQEIKNRRPASNTAHCQPLTRWPDSQVWGGTRSGAGRPKSTNRCHCGKHTMARAVSLLLRCRRPPTTLQ